MSWILTVDKGKEALGEPPKEGFRQAKAIWILYFPITMEMTVDIGVNCNQERREDAKNQRRERRREEVGDPFQTIPRKDSCVSKSVSIGPQHWDCTSVLKGRPERRPDKQFRKFWQQLPRQRAAFSFLVDVPWGILTNNSTDSNKQDKLKQDHVSWMFRWFWIAIA